MGDARHPVVVCDYTPTRARAGPAKFLQGYTGYLQADAYSVYDGFFKPERGMTEVGVEERAKALSLSAAQRLALRQRVSTRIIGKLEKYLLELRKEVLSQEPVRRSRALRPESMDSLFGRRRAGDR